VVGSATAAASEPDSAPPDEEFLGVVLARQSVDVSAKLDGRIEQVHVQLGQRVPRNGVIATLDVRSIQQELAMAEAALEAAEAEHERAALELADARERLERSRNLGDLVARETLANSQYQEKIAAARVESARAQIAERRARAEQLRETIADATLRAPFEGVVAARYLDPGTVVTPGTPVISLISAGDLRLRFAVPEKRAADLAAGQRVSVRLETVPVQLQGTVEHVAPEVDAAARMVFVEARLESPESPKATIPSGAVARVSVPEALGQR